MFHLDPNEMIERNLALREQQLRRTAERARLLGDHREASLTGRVFVKAFRGAATTLSALVRRNDRRRASVQEGCA
jgi:hypothetical protein